MGFRGRQRHASPEMVPDRKHVLDGLWEVVILRGPGGLGALWSG